MSREIQLTGILFSIALIVGIAWATQSRGQTGYDQYGYNYAERKFKGLYENVDRDLTNNTGQKTELQMEWNDLFNPIQPEFSGDGAWVKNFQSGTYTAPDGKTYRWSYSVRILYTGPESPLWGYFSLVQESYTDSGQSPTTLHEPPVLPRPEP